MWRARVAAALVAAFPFAPLWLVPSGAADTAPPYTVRHVDVSRTTPGAALPDPCHWLTSTRVVPCFSDPTADDAVSSAIFQSLQAMVASAQPGDTIRVVHYYWGDGPYAEPLAHELVAAYQRGVDVRVILDENSDGKAAKQILLDGRLPLTTCDDWDQATEAPGTGPRPANCLMIDERGYYGPDSELPMTHTKLWLLDIGGVKSVVEGSSNLGRWDYESAWNDMVRINDSGLYDQMLAWWNRIQANDWQGWTTDASRERSGDPRTGTRDLQERAYFYPRLSVDPIAEQLSRMTACSSDGDGDGDWDKRVYVAISKWSADQRTGILDNLVRLEGLGCQVRVLVSDSVSASWANTIRARLGDTAGSTTHVRMVCKLHHKFVILDGLYAGNWHEVVINGSNVWAKGSLLYSDELNVRFGGQDTDTDDGAVRAYIDHYADLWNNRTATSC